MIDWVLRRAVTRIWHWRAGRREQQRAAREKQREAREKQREAWISEIMLWKREHPRRCMYCAYTHWAADAQGVRMELEYHSCAEGNSPPHPLPRAMARYPRIALIVLAAACSPHEDASLQPRDADGERPEVPTGDARIDAPLLVEDLAALCGAVPVTLDAWERCYQKRWCEAMVGCVPQNGYRDVQECLDRSNAVEGGRLDAERLERASAVSQGRATIDAPTFTQCLIDTSAARCTTVWSSEACAKRFTGTVADGASCLTDVECASPGATCESSCTDACCTGTCRPRFRLGQACDAFDSCEPGLMCHRTCLSGDIGASCESDRDCDADTWCDTGRCRPDFMLGAACTSPLQCGGQASCVGLTIHSSGHCQSIAKAGARCDFFCYGNLYCDGSGVCRDLPQLGQSCSGLAPCSGVDAVCKGGLCALRDGAGTSCTGSRTCLPELFCTSELNDSDPRCVVRRAAGQPCASSSHCDSHACSGTAGELGVCLTPSDGCFEDEAVRTVTPTARTTTIPWVESTGPAPRGPQAGTTREVRP